MTMQTYVVHAYSNYEAKVARSLLERIERFGLESYFGEITVPTESVMEVKDGKKRQVERKFFPGYVLVEMELNDESWQLVKQTPQVLGFIGGTKSEPAPISPVELKQIKDRMNQDEDAPKPKVLYEAGEVVRVIDGPFNDFNGAVESVDFDKNTLRVAVQIFGRSTPVDLEFDQVEKT